MRPTVLQIHERFKRAKKAIVVPHQNADGDALGSAGTIFEFLESLGVKTRIFCLTPVSEKLAFMPHTEKVTTDKEIFLDLEVDIIVVVDSGDLKYAGIYELVKDHPAEIINIDHHFTNARYGHHNLVIPTASSACEVIYHFLRHLNAKFSHRMATLLLTGIITDTDNFTNSATSESAMSAAGELIRRGGNLNMINEHTVRNKTINLLHLWGDVLNRLDKNEKLGMVYTYLKLSDLEKHNVSENESEGIANFLNNLEDTQIALILKETQDGKIKGSFRTTKDNVDVSALAKKMGGGGHIKAAGFSTAGTIAEVLEKIMAL